MMNISLDVESTLADTNSIGLDSYNSEHGTEYTPDDIDSWDWVREELDFESYMNIVQHNWKYRYEYIEPLEKSGRVSSAISRLSSKHNVDVVTARQGVENQMKYWLIKHGMDTYEKFESVPREFCKSDLGYDIFIDDKPSLGEGINDEQVLYLIDKPYNRTGVRDKPNVFVVDTVEQAANDLLMNPITNV